MPPELIPSDSEYASEEDSDFSPDVVPVANEEGSSDEESDADEVQLVRVPADDEVKAKGRKRKRVDEDGEEAEDVGFENSGDEAILKEGGEGRRRKKGRKGKEGREKSGLDWDDEGGEGGLVKTRSMRAKEVIEKKPLVDTTAATIDVDAVWEAMLSGKTVPSSLSSKPETPIESSIQAAESILTPTIAPPPSKSPRIPNDGSDAMIMIKRTYTFAGKVHTEQKLVPRNSAEAKLYLASQPEPSSVSAPAPATTSPPPDSPFTKPKRPTKKARRSIFEPVTEIPHRMDLYFGARKPVDAGALAALGAAGAGKEKKLNTVEKSAMDWAGFVDKEGIKDELDQAGKSKWSFKERQEFLARVEGRKEVEERRVRGLPV